MAKDAFTMREQALENEFFYFLDQQLLERIRADLVHDKSLIELASLTGISSDAVLEELIEAGVERHALMAFTLIPLAFVAWADGHVDEKERQAVLNTMAALGHGDESASYALLAHWLTHRPDDRLFETWKGHAAALINNVSHDTRQELANTIAQRTEKVACATGGVLGLGRVSASERDVLTQVRESLLMSEPQ